MTSPRSPRAEHEPKKRTPRARKGVTVMTDRTGATVVNEDRLGSARWWKEIGWRHVIGLIAVVYAAFPILYVFSASLNSQGTLTGSNSLFSDVGTENYAKLTDTLFWTWVSNTLIIGSVTAIGTVLLGAAAAYAFSRFRFSGRRFGLTTLLVLQMFPQLLAFVAIFLLLLGLGQIVPALGLNSKIALICVYLGGALGTNTFLMYGFFNTVPKELDEAARIDGCGHWRIFFNVIMPLMTPAIATTVIFTFIWTWNDFFSSLIYLTKPDMFTVPIALKSFLDSTGGSNWGAMFAMSIVSLIPVFLVFLFGQRFLIRGIATTGIK